MDKRSFISSVLSEKREEKAGRMRDMQDRRLAHVYTLAQGMNCSCTKPKLTAMFVPLRTKTGKLRGYEYAYDSELCMYQHGIRDGEEHQPLEDAYALIRDIKEPPTPQPDDLLTLETVSTLLGYNHLDEKTGKPVVKKPNKIKQGKKRKADIFVLSDHESDGDDDDDVSSDEEQDEENSDEEQDNENDIISRNWRRDHHIDIPDRELSRREHVEYLENYRSDFAGEILPPAERIVTHVNRRKRREQEVRSYADFEKTQIKQFRKNEMKRRKLCNSMLGRRMSICTPASAQLEETLFNPEVFAKHRRDLERVILKNGGIMLHAQVFDAVTKDPFVKELAEKGILARLDEAPTFQEQNAKFNITMDDVKNNDKVKRNISQKAKKAKLFTISGGKADLINVKKHHLLKQVGRARWLPTGETTPEMCELILPFGRAFINARQHWEICGTHVHEMRTLYTAKIKHLKESFRIAHAPTRQSEENMAAIRKDFHCVDYVDPDSKQMYACLNANWKIITGQQAKYSGRV